MNESDVVRFAIQCLDAECLLYLVTESLASSYYGEARFTHDADIAIWLGSEPERVVPLCRRFEPPEFYVSIDAAMQAATERGQFNVIHPATAFKIDFMILRDSVYDRARLERARRVELVGGIAARMSSPEDVIVKKLEYYREGGSEKHLRDIASMLLTQGDAIDRAYTRAWAEQFGVLDIWRAICDKVDAAGAG